MSKCEGGKCCKEKYNEWKKTQKTLYISLSDLKWMPDGSTLILVRAGDHGVKVGDVMGGAKVLKCMAYGKEFDNLDAGMTGEVTFDRVPTFTIEETYVN